MKLRNSRPLVLTVHKCRTSRMAELSLEYNTITISSAHKSKRPTYTGYTIIYSDKIPINHVYLSARQRVIERKCIKDTICLYCH